MSGKNNEQVLRRVIEEGFSRGNLDALDDCFAGPYVEHQFDLLPDLAKLKESIRALRNTFPDFSLTIEDMAADGDTVWARSIARGTNSHPYMGRPPTDRSFSITVIDIVRLENGRIVEHWGVPDRFHLLLQLGFLSPGPADRPGIAAGLH